MSNQLINKPLLGTPLNWSHPLAKGLVGCWIMNEGGGNRIYNLASYPGIPSGEFINNTKFLPSSHGVGLYFDGVNDAVHACYANSVPASLTVIAKIRLSAVGANRDILSIYDTDSVGNQAFRASVNSSNVVQLITKVSGTARTIVGVTALVADKYYTVGMSTGSAFRRLYLDGKLEAVSSNYPYCDNNPGYMLIGGSYSTVITTVAYDYYGYIDYVYFYNRQLLDSEVTYLHIDPYQMFRPFMPVWMRPSGTATVYELIAESGAVIVAGANANLLRSTLLDAGSGSVGIAGTDVGLLKSSLLDAQTGAVTLAGVDVDLLKSSLLNLTSGAVTVTGIDVSLLKSSLLNASAGEVTIAGINTDLLKSSLLNCSSGALVIAGADVELIYTTGAVIYTLNCTSGAVTIAGTSLDMLKSSLLSAETGATTVAGTNVDLFLNRVLLASPGAVVVDGPDVTLLKDSLLGCSSGTISIAGLDADLFLNRVLAVNPGTVEVTGQDADLLRDALLTMSSGQVIIGGQTVTLTYSGESYSPQRHIAVILSTPTRIVTISYRKLNVALED